MNTVDFLPQRIKAGRLRRRRRKVHACLLLLCVGLTVVLGHVRQGQIATARADAALIARRADTVRDRVSETAELEGQLGQLRIVGRIEEHLGRRVNTLGLLAELERRMPATLALTELKIETVTETIPILPAEQAGGAVARDAAAIRNKKIKRVRLTLTGLALRDVDVATFIGQLSAGAMFEDVNMGYTRSKSRGERAVKEFQASCTVSH